MLTLATRKKGGGLVFSPKTFTFATDLEYFQTLKWKVTRLSIRIMSKMRFLRIHRKFVGPIKEWDFFRIRIKIQPTTVTHKKYFHS